MQTAKQLANLTNKGKGRKKGVPNRITPEVKALAEQIVRHSIMEKDELLERLSRQARADIGRHLKIDDTGQVRVEIDLEHADTIRSIEPTALGLKIKVDSSLPALAELADIYGLKNQPPPSIDMKVLIQELQANLTPAQLHEAALAALSQED